MDTKLKPCPFCGVNAKLVKSALCLYGKGNYSVRCRKCGCGTEPLLPEEDAIKIWNTRVERTYKRHVRYKLLSRKEQIMVAYCECGQELDRLHTWELLHLPNYCPNCGVKVKE